MNRAAWIARAAVRAVSAVAASLQAIGSPLQSAGTYVQQRWRQRWQQRWRQWWQARLTPRERLALTQRNLYILPTRPGLMWAATLLVLLLASINEQLSLGYWLCFTLVGCGLVGMHMGHANLRGMVLTLVPPAPCFEGGAMVLSVRLINPSRRTRHGLGLAPAPAIAQVHSQATWTWTDVPALGETQLQLRTRAARRGRHAVPVLQVQTRFPLGAFRVWSVWKPAAQVWVYPAPEAQAPPWPLDASAGADGAWAQGQSSGSFDGVRSYQPGDSLRQVVWKKSARAMASGSGELISRHEAATQSPQLWLDHAQAGPAPRKWSRLCAWVLRADAQGLRYGLRLPSQTLEPAQGEAHKRACLEALALC